MEEIFLSWGMPDKSLVDRIIGRLADLGMPVNEYSRMLRAGGEIRPYIVRGINRARMVLAIVSVEALDHSDWVRNEVTLAAGRLDNPDNKLERLVLVRVGHVPDERIPVLLQPDRLKFLDLDREPTEEQLALLISELRRALGQNAPFVVPAALFAMTRREFDRFRDPDGGHDPEKIARLTALCHSAGMPAPPDLWDQLGSRYGATVADFAPYGTDREGGGRRLIDVAQDALRTVNERRSMAQLQPLYLKWYSREDFSDDTIRDQWGRGYSVLIVDSVSALEPIIATALQSLPLPVAPDKAAVICLPPYTRHNVELEELIRQCLDGQFFLTDNFRAWRDRSERLGLAFDLPAETSLRRWLGQLLLALETALEPDQDNLSRMLQDRAPRPLPALPGIPGD
jgi:TIR domain